MIIKKLVCSAKRSFRKGCRENPIERVVPLRLCILSSYKERMCRVQGGRSACIGLIGALLAAGKPCGRVAYKVIVINKCKARNVVLCEKISNR